MKFEICVDNVDSLIRADSFPIDRIELCASLATGGITPSASFIRYAVHHCKKPIYVMIRPRGGDFVFNEAEKLMMLEDIKLAKSLGVNGVVIGALNEKGELDLAFLQTLVNEAKGLQITFHRAFDLCLDPFKALEEIIHLGCHTILTSGQEANAKTGIPLLKELVEQAKGRIDIMAGAGVNPMNAKKIAQSTKVQALHFSASQLIPSPYPMNKRAVMGKNAESDLSISVTSWEKVKAIIDSVQ